MRTFKTVLNVKGSGIFRDLNVGNVTEKILFPKFCELFDQKFNILFDKDA
ncbi:MAG: hypothetical protein RBG13Loki_3408 [Promethearchaeota archaeon CR_4]|nr:MAG: hypothetical protein RBG13Loki_3408 [Candidatus Lokiarchaeota archaeon CR_4]